MIPSRTSAQNQAVLLDLDGTLVASREGIVASIRLAFADLGHEIHADLDLTWVVGPPLHDIMTRLLADFGDDRTSDAVARYRHHYEGGGLFQSPLFPGIRDVLDQLSASGRRLFLATSKPVHTARRILDAHGVTPLFDELYGARPDDSGAEKSELIARLLKQEAVDPAHAVMVGDRRFDISGAQANGVRTIGVLWGYGGRAELEAAGADVLVASTDLLVATIRDQIAASVAHAKE
ncbi:HAD hydrolase-like protein [Lichenicola cladoniae]|uniref:HAD hydrolase-like protein n=1 Tax=Lichenicola cladoniae TaxID=1484109 RepID=A0A6M8HNH1_9PROT|nr:HAD hydrolase-like protein [Lichenicola cladoniae]NPD67350.1 HAD hydrolase-like protein [Acetobacteraceae bacterium]QKE89850.1 HAD hydrolase-like protein [Lichenicola cladoniae]